jgi:hypothetical protein
MINPFSGEWGEGWIDEETRGFLGIRRGGVLAHPFTILAPAFGVIFVPSFSPPQSPLFPLLDPSCLPPFGEREWKRAERLDKLSPLVRQ